MAGSSRSRGPKTRGNARTSVRTHLRPWARDAVGIGLVVLGLLAVLGLWFEAAGPVGRGLDWLLHATFGLASVVFPLLALYWGLVLLRGAPEQERLRMFIGFAIAAVGVLGLLSLWQGNPRPVDGYARVGDAAGVLGALAAWPLGELVSGIGVLIVWGGAVLLGLLIFTGTPLSAIWERILEVFTREKSDEGEDEETEPVAIEAAEPEEPRVVDSGDFALVELPEDAEGDEDEPEAIEVPALVRRSSEEDYELPSLDLLRTSPPSAGSDRDEEHQKAALERTFHTFGVPAHVVAAHRGPTVTLYEVEVEAGTKVNKVLSLADDIAYALETP